MLSRFHLIPERHGQPDRRTELLYQYRASVWRAIKIVECTISSEVEQNVSKTLISLAILRRVKYGRFWLLSGRREIGAEIRELPENTGDLATLFGTRRENDTGTVLDPITAPQLYYCTRPQSVPAPLAAFCPHPRPVTARVVPIPTPLQYFLSPSPPRYHRVVQTRTPHSQAWKRRWIYFDTLSVCFEILFGSM